MKLEVWSDLKAEELTRIRLLQEGGYVVLTVVDAKGRRIDGGNILTLDGRGVKRMECLAEKFGFDCDSHGRIVVR